MSRPDDHASATRLTIAAGEGDEAAAERLLPLVYDELRALAGSLFRRQPAGHTLQPTALVNEAYLRLVDRPAGDWSGRDHFFAVAAMAMRQILVDHARRKGAGGEEQQRRQLDHRGDARPRCVAPGARSTFLLGMNEGGDMVGYTLPFPPAPPLPVPFVRAADGTVTVLEIPGMAPCPRRHPV